jgi:hypothetical protein
MKEIECSRIGPFERQYYLKQAKDIKTLYPTLLFFFLFFSLHAVYSFFKVLQFAEEHRQRTVHISRSTLYRCYQNKNLTPSTSKIVYVCVV